MELLFGFRGAGPQKGHRGREVEGWAGQTGTDEDTGAGWQGCMAHTTHTSAPTNSIKLFPQGMVCGWKKRVKLSWSHSLKTYACVICGGKVFASEKERVKNMMLVHAMTCRLILWFLTIQSPSKSFFVYIFLTEVTVNICYENLFDKDVVKLS